jgi:hypothetical protein
MARSKRKPLAIAWSVGGVLLNKPAATGWSAVKISMMQPKTHAAMPSAGLLSGFCSATHILRSSQCFRKVVGITKAKENNI